jgi:hypothetical protein
VGERHSRTVKHRRGDESGHQKNSSGRGTLTSCRAQSEGQIRKPKETEWARGTHSLSTIEAQVRTAKETERARGTHPLSNAEGGISQGTGNRVDESHSQSVEHRGRESSGHQKELWGPQGNSHSVEHRGTSQDTEKNRAGESTHGLSTTEEGTSQDTERNRASEGHSHPVNHRGTSQDTERNQASEGHSRTVSHRGRDKS